jgi:hypothetical protein
MTGARPGRADAAESQGKRVDAEIAGLAFFVVLALGAVALRFAVRLCPDVVSIKDKIIGTEVFIQDIQVEQQRDAHEMSRIMKDSGSFEFASRAPTECFSGSGMTSDVRGMLRLSSVPRLGAVVREPPFV